MNKVINELNGLTIEEKVKADKIKLNLWLYLFNINKTLFDENWLNDNSFTFAGGGINELITSLNNFN